MQNWTLEQQDEICLLSFDKPDSSQNVLSSDALQELAQAVTEIESMAPAGLVIQSTKSRGFIAGADVKEFSQIESRDQGMKYLALAHDVLDRIESLPFPTAAMINGHCLGGGLELALACDYRVCCEEPSIRLGLPEVMLGIHPGFGGTVRLIETCGVPGAMDLILSGRTVVPKVARKMGIIDLAVPLRQLRSSADYMLEKKPARARARGWKSWLNLAPARSLMAPVLARKVAARAKPEHYPAPYAVIDLWKKHGGNRRAMLDAEQQSVADLVTTPTSRNLVKVFFLQENLKSLGKSVGKSDHGNSKVRRVHVVGAGVMGGDIASWSALRGLQVTIQDQSHEALAKANARTYALFRKKLRDPYLVKQAMDRFQPDLAGSGARNADVIIEAIFENAEAKMALFTELEKIARPDAILATNTSSIPLETLCTALSSPERLVGLHFFNPVAKMQLVEIVRGDASADDVCQRAAEFAGQINRLPLPVKSRPGFLVNRVLMPYLMEAVALHNEGVPDVLIDQIATDFGMPMGPITLADTVGLDICQHVASNLSEAFGGEVPEVLVKKVADGKLGKKTGEGFYTWSKGKPDKSKTDNDYVAPDDLEDRLLFRYLNETVACLHEGIVDDSELADGGLVFGTGFAPFRGGPVNYIVDQGQQAMLERLLGLQESYGERFKPGEGWTELELGNSNAGNAGEPVDSSAVDTDNPRNQSTND